MLDPKRKNVLGMTDIAILMGACPPKWGNARSIWMEKKGLYVKPETDRMRNGHTFEPVIQTKFIEHMIDYHSLIVEPVNTNVFVQHDTLPIGGTTDFIGSTSGGKIGSEFKSTSWLDDWGEGETDNVPYRVKIQVNGYMLLHELTEWEVMALLFDRGAEFRHYTICRDEALINQIKQVACAFWDTYILGGEEPEDTPIEPPFPIPSVETAPPTPELAALMSKASQLSMRISSASPDADIDEYDRTINEIKAKFGSAKFYTNDGWKASWSRKIEDQLDTEAAYHALRDMFLSRVGDADFVRELERAHTKQKATQRFTFKEEKVKK